MSVFDFDVVVIGAGPAGCAVARDLAAAGRRVLVVEEHPVVGEPVQCAGLISARTLELSGVSPRVVLHRLKGARVHGPGGRTLTLAGSRAYALAVDRASFDRELARQALEAGAQIRNSCRAVDFKYIPGGVRVTLAFKKDDACAGAGSTAAGFSRTKLQRDAVAPVDTAFCTVTCRLVVGADGHGSTVARWLGVPAPAEKIPMYAAEVTLPAGTDSLVDIFIGRSLVPGWFGWLIPLGDGRARVGVGNGLARGKRKMPGKNHPRALFNRLADAYPRLFHDMRIIRATGGLVPVGLMPRTYGPHALLVGDAAAQVKPISGGGLYLGLKAARLCARTALDALETGRYDAAALAAYQDAWEKTIGPEILCGLRHRETYLHMHNREMDALLAFFDRPYWRKIILKYGDLDYHSRLAARLIQAPPWARRFVTGRLLPLLQMLTAGGEN